MARIFGLSTESDNLRNLDFLRFIASLAIVYHHSHEYFIHTEERTAVFTRSVGLGLFVDLFFMISGFVIAYAYEARIGSTAEYLRFLWRRVARLYPLHLVVLALNIALWAILLSRGSSDSAPSFSPDCIAATTLLVQEYVDCGSSIHFNGVTWSISVEMGMYILMPAFMLLARLGNGWLAAATASAIALAAFFTPPGGEWLGSPHLLRGLAGFATGYLLFRIRDRIPDFRYAAIGVPVLCIAALVAIFSSAPQALSLSLLAALMVVSISADQNGKILPVLEKACPLGQLTYSIYLWHTLFILALINVVADKLFYGNIPILIAATALCYASIFLASYAGYWLIEVPGRRLLAGLAAPAWKNRQAT
ncbi:acyltransferase [Altererythrobacter fulvus]|uniref:acyltransferase family protein n=1 Tax=Caenibius fulvus TaxID=2126012 RepID=UPI003018AC63